MDHKKPIMILIFSILYISVLLYYYIEKTYEYRLSKDEAIIDFISKSRNLQDFRERIVAALYEDLSSELREMLVIPVEDRELETIQREVSSLWKEVHQIKNSTLALRQAINPKNPDEILTIARLNDQVQHIEQRFNELNQNLEDRHLAFTTAINRQVEANTNLTFGIIIALLPISLSIAYQYKDRGRLK